MEIIEKFRFDGKVALITGGTRGLGKAMAESLAEAGAEIVIVGRDQHQGEKTTKEIIEKTGKRVEYFKGDVSKYDDIENFVNKTIHQFGKIDILITSAGINIRQWAVEFNEEDVKKLFEINFLGTWYTCKIVGKHMIERRYGRIITVGSILSFVTIPQRSIYSSTKGAVLQLTKTLAVEWAKYNITVNCLCPGVFNTEINRKILENPEIKQSFIEKIPVGRIGEPEEIGAIAVLLASDACPFMTGSAVIVDGGWTAL